MQNYNNDDAKIVINGSLNDLMEISKAKTVDTRGMAWPYPSFESVKALVPLSDTDIIEVITDNRESALESIPSVCQRRKWEFMVIEQDKHLWQVLIKKKSAV